MTLQIQAEIAPIVIDQDGVARVSGTRVLLETVVSAFQDGDSPEQIVDSFDILTLADVYAVIAYYLKHREDVDDYIHQQNEAEEQLQQEIEKHQPEMFRLQKRLQILKQSYSMQAHGVEENDETHHFSDHLSEIVDFPNERELPPPTTSEIASSVFFSKYWLTQIQAGNGVRELNSELKQAS